MSAKRNSSSSATTTSSSKVCCFCNLAEDNELEYGKLYEQDGIVTHYYCLLLSSNMEQKGNDDEGILGFLAEDIHKELRRGKKLACSYCKRIGATLGCCNVKCKRIFHFPCGLRAGSLHQFFGQFKSFCVNHRPKQKIDEYVSNQISTLNDMLCYICYDRVDPKDLMETLWAPCCKKDAWFHRKCVQQLALSAGYFFKCPLCNNKKDFQNAMLQYGIFIPSQDASWELVPNAFEELLYRHDHCNAAACLCPKGRKHTSSNAKWELVLCRTCGSQGIHMACGKLKWANPVWECDECTSILCNAKEHNSPKSGDSSDSSSLSRDSDSDESDSDISVGTDFPMLCPSSSLLPSPSSSSTLVETSFKSRPGPRSFKLQQLKACGMADSLVNAPCASAPASTPATTSTINKASKKNNSTQESKMGDSQQMSKKYHCKEDKKLPNNDMKSQSNTDENVITIDSDDDDDVEIIALKHKVTIPTVQIAWANIFPSKSDNLSNSIENSADKKEIDPLQTGDQSCAKNRDSTKESNVSKSRISSGRRSATPKQAEVTALQESTQKSERESMQKPTQESTQESTQEPIHEPIQETMQKNTQDITQVAASSNNDDSEISEDSSSIMNIKITNVTSLPPEVFASVPEIFTSVPDVGLDEDVTWIESDTVDTSSAIIKPLEKWVVSQHKSSSTTMKRSIREEANNAADNNCKKIKGNSLDETFVDTVMRDKREQRAESKVISDMENSKIIEDTASITKISSPFSSTSQKNDTPAQAGKRKVDAAYTIIESNHHPKKSDNPSIVNASPQNSKSDSVQLYTPIIQSSNQFYYSVPSPNMFYPVSSLPTLEKENTAATLYSATSGDVIRTSVIQNNATISKHQSVVMAESINPDVIITDSQKTEGSGNEKELLKEKTADGPPADNESSRIVCDGDAGRTNPAVAPTRPACFSEAAENAGTTDISDASITGREVEQRRDSPRFVGPRKFHKRPYDESDTMHIMSFGSRLRSIRAQCSVFPQVTNNHNACHQPRLIPQYMHLHDLKFRVCRTNDIKMILYDTFSVNIAVEDPVEDSAEDNKIRPGIATPKVEPHISQVRCEASSSSNHINDGSLESRLTDNKTECTANAMAIVTHDDAKENLDPVSKTVPCNVISANTSLVNGVDDANSMNDTWQREHDAQMRLGSSDVNANALGRATSNTSIGNNNTGKDDDYSQNSRVDHWESVQRKQPTPATEESGWLPHRRTIHSIDSDLNIVRTNKNVEKVLQNNVTVTANWRVDDKAGDSSRATDDSPTSRSHNLSYTTANHRSSNHAHSDVTKSRPRDQKIASVPNITFNESSISNKQIDACDSSQLIRCMAFHADENGYKDDPTVKVSIDLHKIKNLIDSKPKLFGSDEEVDTDDDSDGHRYISRLHDEDSDYTQQQAKFHDCENDNTRHPSLRNGELQTLDRTSIEKIELRDPLYASANSFNRYRKRERESKYFDRRNR